MLLLWLGLPLVATACSFSSPKGSQADDGGDDDNGGDDDTDPPPTCPDADKDTTCDAADKCPGHDDRKDADTDGIADGCDDWPCGMTKPGDPGGVMSDEGSDGRDWGATFINIGDDRRLVVNAGQPFNARFTWGLTINCGGSQNSCPAQVEIGYGQTRTGCVYDNDVGDDAFIAITFSGQLTAPATSGMHELRLNAGRNASCGTGTSWYGGDPGSDSTIAILCVRP